MGPDPKALEADSVVRGWFQKDFADVYLAHKRGEIAHVESLPEAARIDAYAEVY